MKGKRTDVIPGAAPASWHRFLRLERYLRELFGDGVVIDSDDLATLPEGVLGEVHLELKTGAVIVHEGRPGDKQL